MRLVLDPWSGIIHPIIIDPNTSVDSDNIINKQKIATDNKINLSNLKKSKLINKKYKKLKLLGGGELKLKLDIEVNFISKSAKEKIEKLGGKVTLIK